MDLSICMMVKNEEKNLERCLKSLQPFFEKLDTELIIVDTGSEDNTVEIASRYTEKVFFHSWNHDFSAMRNISISYATGKWLMIIDADEEINNVQPLIEFLQTTDSKRYGAIAITCKNIVDNVGGFSIMASFRLFKNDGYFHYEGAVHNQPMFRGKDTAILTTFLLHYGYLSNDSELMEKKFLRTSEILKNELKKNPNNIYYWTQLATTYGMHHDQKESIECIEKAYSLLPEIKTAQYIFVFTQMILIYQHAKKYDEVEKICREALAIKEGYLDVYYYLAEALAIKEKYSEAIENYEKYLQIMNDYDKATERDISIMEYSLGNQQLVFYNLSNLYKNEQLYDKALYYAEQVIDEDFIKDNISTVIFLYMKLDKFDSLREYFEKNIKVKYIDLFFSKLDILKNSFNSETQVELAKTFVDLNHEYNLLCQLIIDNEIGYISLKTQEALKNINLADLPIYCSDIFYYLLKLDFPLQKTLVEFKESWLNCVFDYIKKQHELLSVTLYEYLQKQDKGTNFLENKINKALCRYALLLNKLDIIQYKAIFDFYLSEGTAYMNAVYSSYVINNALVYDVKNDEDVFFLYMHHAFLNRKNDQARYLSYLRNALQAFPDMSRGISYLLSEIQMNLTTEINEFDNYKLVIKNKINSLIMEGNMLEAKQLLSEYKKIVSNDIETILLESKIMLN